MARLYLSGCKEVELVTRALFYIANSLNESSDDRELAYAIYHRLLNCHNLQGYKSKKNRQQ